MYPSVSSRQSCDGPKIVTKHAANPHEIKIDSKKRGSWASAAIAGIGDDTIVTDVFEPLK